MLGAVRGEREGGAAELAEDLVDVVARGHDLGGDGRPARLARRQIVAFVAHAPVLGCSTQVSRCRVSEQVADEGARVWGGQLVLQVGERGGRHVREEGA